MTKETPILTTHGGFLLFVLSKQKAPIQQSDLAKQTFPFWLILTKRMDEWLGLSDDSKKHQIGVMYSSFTSKILDTFSDLVIKEIKPNGDRYVSIAPQHRAGVIAFSKGFWKIMQPYISKADISRVQAEVQRVYPSSAPQIHL